MVEVGVNGGEVEFLRPKVASLRGLNKGSGRAMTNSRQKSMQKRGAEAELCVIKWLKDQGYDHVEGKSGTSLNSGRNDSLHYDILYVDDSKTYYVEVKACDSGEFHISSGELEFAKKNSEGGVRFGVGGGVNVYFVRDPSNPLYGLYVGASAGIIGYYLGDDDSEFDKRRQTESWDEPYFSESAVALGLEVGKLWHVTEMWNVGVASQLSLDSPQRDEDDDNLYCVLTFKVTIVRK